MNHRGMTETEDTTDRRVGECSENRGCRDTCDDIFRSRRDREECEELSIADVERMEDVFKVLENPDGDDLEDLDLEVLEELLDINSDPLKTAISRMNQSEKKDFLLWFAEDSEAAQLIIDVEEEFDIREALFERFIVNPSSRSDLNQNIKGGKTFVELALEEGNEPVLEWLHSSFEITCERFRSSPRDEDYPLCVFNIYCGWQLDIDIEDEYFGYEFFTDLLDEVLVHGRRTRTPPSWWTIHVEADDLDTWTSGTHDVCRYRIFWDW